MRNIPAKVYLLQATYRSKGNLIIRDFNSSFTDTKPLPAGNVSAFTFPHEVVWWEQSSSPLYTPASPAWGWLMMATLKKKANKISHTSTHFRASTIFTYTQHNTPISAQYQHNMSTARNGHPWCWTVYNNLSTRCCSDGRAYRVGWQSGKRYSPVYCTVHQKSFYMI